MKHTSAFLVLLVTSLVGENGALAGRRNAYPLVVNSTTRTVTGSLGTARNQPSDFSTGILCKITAIASNSSTTLRCEWKSIDNILGSCSSTNAALVATARAINGDSNLTVRWDTLGKCTELVVSNDSSAEPKQP